MLCVYGGPRGGQGTALGVSVCFLSQAVKFGCKHRCPPSRLTNPVLYFSNFLHAVCPSESPLGGPGVFQLPFSENRMLGNRGSRVQDVADSPYLSVTPTLNLYTALGLLSRVFKYITSLTRRERFGDEALCTVCPLFSDRSSALFSRS